MHKINVADLPGSQWVVEKFKMSQRTLSMFFQPKRSRQDDERYTIISIAPLSTAFTSSSEESNDDDFATEGNSCLSSDEEQDSAEAVTSQPLTEEQDSATAVTPQPSSQVTVCESMCCTVSHTLSLHQVKDKGVIKKTRVRYGQRFRKFCTDWYGTYPWLVLCSRRLKAFCGYCCYGKYKGILTDKNADQAFTDTGFNNWKKAYERFEQHIYSNAHKEVVMKIDLLSHPSVDVQVSTQRKKEQSVRREMFLIVLSSLKYLVRQGLAIRGHREIEGNLMQLLLLRASDHPELKQYMDNSKCLSHDILGELVSMMGRYVLNHILTDVKKAGKFSLIADEVSDVSHMEQSCVSLRWVNIDFEIQEKPLELVHVPKTDAETLTAVIKDCLIRFSLPITQCRGQAYDGAANMRGPISGVAKRIQQEEPTAIFVHCLAHSNNLCLKALASQSSCVHDTLDLVMGLSQLIRFSPKRSSLFATLQVQMSLVLHPSSLFVQLAGQCGRRLLIQF